MEFDESIRCARITRRRLAPKHCRYPGCELPTITSSDDPRNFCRNHLAEWAEKFPEAAIKGMPTNPERFLRWHASNWTKTAKEMEKMGYVPGLPAEKAFYVYDLHGARDERPKYPVDQFTIEVTHGKRSWDFTNQCRADLEQYFLKRKENSRNKAVKYYDFLPSSLNIRVTHTGTKGPNKTWQQYYLKVTREKNPSSCVLCNKKNKEKHVIDFPITPQCDKAGECGGKRFVEYGLVAHEYKRTKNPKGEQVDSFMIDLSEENVSKLLSSDWNRLNKLTFEFIPYTTKVDKKSKKESKKVEYKKKVSCTAAGY